MKRRTLILVVGILLVALLLAACGPSNGAATGDTKHGLGTINRINKSKDAGEADGLAQTDAVIASVVIDSEGKIVSVIIDTVQSRINFTEEGKIASDPATLVMTKKEQGDDYGMKARSALNKEWDEQIEALEAWMVGKTLSDIEGMALTDGKPDDLKATVSITVSDYLEAVKKAIANAA